MTEDNTMKKIDEAIKDLEAIAGKLKGEGDEAKATAEPNSIICSTTPDGFTFNCNADSGILVKHTVTTLEVAFGELEGIDKATLAIQVMRLLSKVAKVEKDKCTK